MLRYAVVETDHQDQTVRPNTWSCPKYWFIEPLRTNGPVIWSGQLGALWILDRASTRLFRICDNMACMLLGAVEDLTTEEGVILLKQVWSLRGRPWLWRRYGADDVWWSYWMADARTNGGMKLVRMRNWMPTDRPLFFGPVAHKQVRMVFGTQ